MTTPKKYDDQAVAKVLGNALKALPDKWVACRDMRHAWATENDFHVVPQSTVGGRSMHVGRDLVCMRCETRRHEVYLSVKGGRLEKVGQSYEYPEGYQIAGVPRGVKPQQIVQAEMYRRAMEKVARAAKGERETAER